jgi:hypothetical protein
MPEIGPNESIVSAGGARTVAVTSKKPLSHNSLSHHDFRWAPE